jgi:aspartyl-tRNA(Asn)/glutamyl-tRNA(Gln) amidotransferase subunit C
MISEADFKKLQKLSKLSFSKEETPIILEKLNGIMLMMDDIGRVDCEGIVPLRSVCDMEQPMRSDIVTSSDISDQLFSNIPIKGSEFAKEIKCFIVPKVVE